MSEKQMHEYLTVGELCDEIKISRSTFRDWRAKGRAPKCLKLPNGQLRFKREDIETWLSEMDKSS